MPDLTLFCLTDGEPISNAFPVSIPSMDAIGNLKDLIKAKKTPKFDDLAADELTLWRVSVPVVATNIRNAVFLNEINSKTELSPMDDVSGVFPNTLAKKTIHIIVQRPSRAQPPPVSDYISQKRPTAEELDLPSNKKIRITERWKQYTASDGKAVDLPSSWIEILMLELWEDMRGDKDRTYRRVLSGPMGVGKSYLSYFLAARAYAEGWLVLYIPDAGLLHTETEEESKLELVRRFLALNKDILTGNELEMLVNEYNGKYHVSTHAVWAIFRDLLMSWDRKTLLLVDEHGKLFEKEPYVPVKLKSLNHLLPYRWWGEDAKGSRVIFTGTAHAKYEMTILDESYRRASVVFVGPLSKNVFSNLLDTYPRLRAPAIRRKVTEITNCVPRELVYLSANVKDLPDPISVDDLQKWTESRTKDFLSTAKMYYVSRGPFKKERFYTVLLQTFLGSTSIVDFEWDFLDLGLIYRSKDVGKIGTQHHILCSPAQQALLELFKTLPLPEDTKERICHGSLTHMYHQTNRAQCDRSQRQEPDYHFTGFSHCATLQIGRTSLGSGHENVLTRGYEGYPRFDFMLGPLFIQASISDFGQHNKKDSADIRKAFNDRDNEGTNQIERYLNDVFGSGHSAKIEDNRFVVTRDGAPVPGFRIVYIRGSPGIPAHRELVNKLPDLLHITFEELTEKLFKNIAI
ncbi:hypothetical protein BC939DRAFT_523399 [Gamsiella multidivaricata]|uniref:uncharacterized protein n=1 Tax=Gamsiella multidivaricata TaxID=101098 RepID=UPI00221F6F3E|nr:uncharacterized protein BC939DRAFT_523399 [Gamsiella multidivaricata]KAI7829763.1 hypothetical protein BC939DRAFT_523399 [Gamsiella multidivaricata]